MTLSQTVVDSVDNNVQSMQLAPKVTGFHLEPRCRVCRNDALRRKSTTSWRPAPATR